MTPLRTRALDALRAAARRPNPIWLREVTQSVRAGRTPVAQMLVTAMLTLVMCSMGGMASLFRTPASVGRTLYQAFFSMAFFVVALASPAIAANSVVSEHEGRTWEALLLTGMRPAEIARGKLLAAATTVGGYLAMIAPVGALPFLFGGVAVTEVVVGFVYLGAFAAVGVTFGLAVGSRSPRAATAIGISLIVSFGTALFAFGVFGFGLSYAAHEAWPTVAAGHPVWLPTAYVRAPFGVAYAVYLLVVPALCALLPLWFFYELAVAAMTGPNDDRATGLKRWLLVASPVAAIGASLLVLVGAGASRFDASMAALVAYAVVSMLLVLVFVGDALGPSRRVEWLWSRAGAGAVARWLGPGLPRTMTLVLVTGLLGIALVAGTGVVAALALGSSPAADVARLVAVADVSASFFLFLVGLATWARARAAAASGARIVVVVGFAAGAFGPWVAAMIGGVLRSSESLLVIASPSPLFVVKAFDALAAGRVDAAVIASLACALGWATAGVALFAVGVRRTGQIVAAHHDALARADAQLAAEDAAAEGVGA